VRVTGNRYDVNPCGGVTIEDWRGRTPVAVLFVYSLFSLSLGASGLTWACDKRKVKCKREKKKQENGWRRSDACMSRFAKSPHSGRRRVFFVKHTGEKHKQAAQKLVILVMLVMLVIL
jgi:hypothetical protein